MNLPLDKYSFNIRKLVAQAEVPIAINTDRVKLEHKVDEADRLVVRALLRLATKQEEVFEFPENFLIRWGRHWQEFKRRRLPRWLKQRLPIVNNRVWAISKFPELNIPEDMLSREFIHFRTIKQKLC